MTVSAVVGATGLVGSALVAALRGRGDGVVELSRRGAVPLDLANAGDAGALLRAHRVGVLYCAAAISSVERCELDPAGTAATNVDGTLRLAGACAGAGARMVFFSSEYVFDGEQETPYAEGDACRPLNHYGRQKREVEEALLGARAGHLVVRTSGVFGVEPARKNFVLQLLDASRKGGRVAVATDQVVTPTHAEALAEGCVEAVQRGVTGVLHLAGSDVLARVEFARLVCRTLGLDDEVVEPVPTARMGLRAPRPVHAGLSVDLARTLGLPLRGAGDGLRRLRTRVMVAE
jgi:dTDP-4-dehydrorhamnose reductase